METAINTLAVASATKETVIPAITLRQKRIRARRYSQLATMTSYAAVLALIASIVSVGYQSPVKQQVSNQGLSTAAMEITNPSVDQIVAADLAASTAQVANLSVASNAANLSISLNAKSDLAQTNDNVISKPQIFQAAGENRGITEYITVVGDTVPSVASKFGISSQTVRWANNLTTDVLTPGAKLFIAGTDGVIHTVADGETIDSIAAKYGVDKQRVITYNDLEASGVVAGQRLVLPGGILPQNERPSVRSVTTPVIRFSASAASVGNLYDYGYCTWYAYNRRAEIGRPVGSYWGNAVSWAGYAASSGYAVSNTPAVGAVLQQGGGVAGGYGHVAFVEEVHADGSIRISEMNYAGWNIISSRDIDSGQATAYRYIN